MEDKVEEWKRAEPLWTPLGGGWARSEASEMNREAPTGRAQNLLWVSPGESSDGRRSTQEAQVAVRRQEGYGKLSRSLFPLPTC